MIIATNKFGINLEKVCYFQVKSTWRDDNDVEMCEVYFDFGRSAVNVIMSDEQLQEFMNQHFIKVL